MRYVVLKIDDIERYCSFQQEEHLSDICGDIGRGRMIKEGKDENRYFVVNTDEPYADEIKQIIEKHEGESA